MPDDVTPPTPPIPPTVWTLQTGVAYVGAFALFVIGLLTSAGVIVPAGVSTDVTVWAGVASQVAAAATALIAVLSRHSVVKTALRFRR